MLRIQRLSVPLVAAFAALVLTSCRTVPAGGLAHIDVHVSSSSAISVKGRKLPLTGLGNRLKSLGAGKNTRVTVRVSRDVSATGIRRILDHLVKHGLPKVIIARKKAPKVFAGPAKEKTRPRKK